jgi:hypothetical protein
MSGERRNTARYRGAKSYVQERRGIGYLLSRFDVTWEEIVENRKRRAAFRLGQMYRRRSRARTLAKNSSAKRRPMLTDKDIQYSGEGELHVLLRMSGLSITAFCKLTGLNVRSFHQWEGHPLTKWPIEFLKNYIWAQKMARELDMRGIDANVFKPVIEPVQMPTGRYPRTADQGNALTEGIE